MRRRFFDLLTGVNYFADWCLDEFSEDGEGEFVKGCEGLAEAFAEGEEEGYGDYCDGCGT